MYHKVLLLSDPHFDSKDSNKYRWDIFPWIIQQVKDLNISTIIIGGDIFNEKDNHPSILVNKFIDSMQSLLEYVDEILMIKGNHDRIDDNNPYLRWVNNIPKIKFFIQPTNYIINTKKFLFLPYTKEPETDWLPFQDKIDASDFIVCHATFDGASADNGTRLSGVSQSMFKSTQAKIYSGDIHQRQILDKVEYIGTPYSITYGENYPHRLILLDLDSDKAEDLHFPTLTRYTIIINKPEEITKFTDIKSGDQVKVRLALNSSEMLDWEKYKTQIITYCKTNQIDYQIELTRTDAQEELTQQIQSKLANLSPTNLLEKYCTENKIRTDLQKYGQTILKEVI